jgi:integrase
VTKYLFQRPGSANWWLKLQAPTNVVKSLQTPDRREAEIIAMPLIAEHKAALLKARPHIEATWRHQYEPGREHINPEGGRIVATDRELIFIDAEGRISNRAANGGPGFQMVGLERRLGIPFPVPLEPLFGEPGTRPVVAVKNGDDVLLETYLKHAKNGPVTGHCEREARELWATFKQLTDNKPLKDCTRDDGRKLVEHYQAQGLRSATIRRKFVWLNGAANLAIREGKLRFNPFAGVAQVRDDSQERKPLDDADMRVIRRELARLSESDQLLLRLLACTGMRLSEAFDVRDEKTERGCRYVTVGTKTKQSKRRVPFPADVLPYLPKVVRGPLFKGSAHNASRRLNRFLKECSIVDPGKVVHSLRHRAQDRLRAAGCPQDVRWAMLGHEKKSVAAGYGEGFPVRFLKRWFDKIGGP